MAALDRADGRLVNPLQSDVQPERAGAFSAF